MPDLGLLQSVGTGQPSKGTKFSPISTQHFFTGLVTNRSPFNSTDGRYNQRFLGGRPDSLIDGLNLELSLHGTYIRRPGFTRFSSATLSGTPLSFYSFHLFNAALANPIDVIADTSTGVYVVGPTSATLLFSKLAGAGQSYFRSVGNTLFWGDGVSQEKYLSFPSWSSNTTFAVGQTITDSNSLLQTVTGETVGHININVLVSNNTVSLTGVFGLSASAMANIFGTSMTLTGFGTSTYLNGAVLQVISATNTNLGTQIITTSFSHADTQVADAGQIIFASGSGISAGSAPTWNSVVGGTTVDGTLIWTNKGSPVKSWGIAAPVLPPTAANALSAATNPWVASTFFWPSQLIVDSNNNLQLLTTGGTTGNAVPVWNLAGTTADNGGGGTAVWTFQGQAAWQAAHSYALGAYVLATFSVSTPIYGPSGNNEGTGIGKTPQIIGYNTITYNNLFRCSVGGMSGGSQPAWRSGVGIVVQDGGVTWINTGNKTTRTNTATSSTNINNSVLVSVLSQIVDSGGFAQNVVTGGLSGAVAPTWNVTSGGSTTDNMIVWRNGGNVTAPNTAAWFYGFAFKNSVTKHVSTMSPASTPIVLAASSYISLSGQGDPNFSADGVDTIEIYRSLQGGPSSTLLFLTDIPAPANGASWNYSDNSPDAQLNPEILGAINFANSSPPVGLGKLTYHLNRIWGAVQNIVYFSAGPDATIGSGNESWPPANVFAFPDIVNRLEPISGGLLVFTTDDIYIIYGTGISTFYPQRFQQGVGLSSYNALDVQGSNIFLYTADRQFISVSSAGINWVGYNIADLVAASFAPSTAHVAALIQGTDQGVYIMDGTANWYRCNWNQPPEGGPAWSPRAAITSGATCVNSIETAPGLHQLLVGQNNGTVLYRDTTVFTDNGTPYSGFITLGSLVFAQPGQIAEIESISVELLGTTTTPTAFILPEEIDPSLFVALPNSVDDPVTLSPSVSVLSKRFYLSQAGTSYMMRHGQVKIGIAANSTPDEICTVSIFGAIQMKEQ